MSLEVRHASFETEDFIALLREYDIALVVADTAGKWPFIENVTSELHLCAAARRRRALR